MDVVDVSRWQFGITTVYHFILVPLTIGLAPMIAVMQTVWHVTGNEQWYRATKFFGKLFLINFALGVATGIVQEFQFGMNWSQYSRFVGDVFGAPLAFEGLIAFFMESTFLGLWIFGWGRLPRRVHLACVWLVAIGVNASAYFIVAANSWMQHPVGALYDKARGRAEMVDFWKVITNNTTLAAFPHVIAGSFLTAGTVVAAICVWWMARKMVRAKALRAADDAGADVLERDANTLYRPVGRFAMWLMIASGAVLFITGDTQGKLMFEQQPMKMASAEALCHTEYAASFSVLTIGTNNNCESVTKVISIPGVTSFLASNRFNRTLKGVEELQQEDVQKFGQANYKPNLFVTYWSFRAMITWAAGSALLAVFGLWFTRKKKVISNPRLGTLALWLTPTPFLANASGWIFTEMGRQPWVVVPNPKGNPDIRLRVAQGVSDHPAGLVLVTLIGFTILYGALGIVWFMLLRRYTIEGPLDGDARPHDDDHDDAESDEPRQLSFAY
ncbi:cytochrome ubiquinol oxidase subunit I [Williamsia sterculiae]|uniref:Cytochrome bd-I ubiquinol oxidase subunit 1 apoprotein n=1 Tax=Williamsia sterculiae TaxID=1344003 RepID=A0A1N7GXE5_9NOCA|nr:cytochrome ubiquinol oxidase subunit I [Williamsia sterculiae]SIS17232.1 cytochrome bd-I ubiquinol oxidase subunit 1 apoprotein [Williamsia sterculiae]